MEILWWLAPPVVATAIAAAWVSWWGREDRGVLDRDEAVARLGAALDPASSRRGALRLRRRRPTRGYAAPPAPSERSGGVAVRVHAPRPLAERPAERPERPVQGPVEPRAGRPSDAASSQDRRRAS